VADEPVVVTNPQPVKAGNRPEDKTEGTLHHVAAGHKGAKSLLCLRRGEDKPKYATDEPSGGMRR
jgi:hypothetical protein